MQKSKSLDLTEEEIESAAMVDREVIAVDWWKENAPPLFRVLLDATS